MHTSRIRHLVQGEIKRSLHMTICKLRLTPHIHHQQVVVKRNIHGKLIRFYVDDHIDRHPRLLPCSKTTIQVSLHLIKTDAGQPYHTFFFFTRGRDQNYRFVKRKKTARPLRESSVQADADGAGDKPFYKNSGFTRIQHNGITFLCQLLEGCDIQRSKSFQQYLVKAFIPFLVDAGVDGEIAGRRSKPFRHSFYKIFFCLLLQGIIAFLFICYRAISIRAQVLSAAAAGAVRGIYHHVVR